MSGTPTPIAAARCQDCDGEGLGYELPDARVVCAVCAALGYDSAGRALLGAPGAYAAPAPEPPPRRSLFRRLADWIRRRIAPTCP